MATRRSLFVVLFAAVFLVQLGAAQKPDKVTVCHFTGSATNPWNVIEISINAVCKDNGGHFGQTANGTPKHCNNDNTQCDFIIGTAPAGCLGAPVGTLEQCTGRNAPEPEPEHPEPEPEPEHPEPEPEHPEPEPEPEHPEPEPEPENPEPEPEPLDRVVVQTNVAGLPNYQFCYCGTSTCTTCQEIDPYVCAPLNDCSGTRVSYIRTYISTDDTPNLLIQYHYTDDACTIPHPWFVSEYPRNVCTDLGASATSRQGNPNQAQWDFSESSSSEKSYLLLLLLLLLLIPLLCSSSLLLGCCLRRKKKGVDTPFATFDPQAVSVCVPSATCAYPTAQPACFPTACPPVEACSPGFAAAPAYASAYDPGFAAAPVYASAYGPNVGAAPVYASAFGSPAPGY